MADTKITALAPIVTVNPATDMMPIVDVDNNSMAASGTTMRISPNQLLGAGGIATLASATITGDLTVDTSTLKVDSANNRVGIRTASPTDSLTIAGSAATNTTSIGLIGTTTGYNRILINNTSGGSQFGVEGATGGNLCVGSTAYATIIGSYQNYPTQFITNNNVVATLDSSGNLLVGVASANANGGVLQLKSGITFPATQVASSDANTLDDYEEGTWTPTPDSGAFSSAVGSYTKVGNMVTLYYDIIVGTGGGDRLTNLPFQAGVTVAQGVFTTAQDYAAGTTAPTLVIGGGASIGYFRTVGDNVVFSAMTFTASAGISGSITYRV